MEVERISVQLCCGTTGVAFKIKRALSKDFLPFFVSNGFMEAKHFTKAGMLYIESKEITASGTFGNNIINIRCKIKDCKEFVNNFENLLTTME